MEAFPTQESMTVEFKADGRETVSDSKVLDAVVGMANADGGKIYIGLKDNGEVVGVRDLKSKWLFGDKARAYVMERTRPPIFVGHDVIMTASGPVAVLTVNRAPYPIASTEGRVLKRRLKADGSPENRVVYPDEYVTELPKEQRYDDSAKIVEDADRSDFSGEERDRLRDQINESGDKSLLPLDDEEFDLALGFLRRNPWGILKPTVCGLLMLGQSKRLQMFLPTARAVFQRLDGGRVLKDCSFHEPIVSTIKQMTQLFEAYNASKEAYLDGIRYVIPDYSPKAFREGLVNALCHRCYTSSAPVRVLMTENSLSITSPGGFLPGITAKNLLYAEPHGRNVLLAQALKRVGYAESTGRGIDTIYLESMRGGRLWPDYEQSTESYVRLELLKSKEEYEFFRLVNRYENYLKHLISVPAMMILALLRNEGPELSLSELMESLPTIVSRDKVRMEANQMVSDGLLLSRGSSRNPTFQIAGLTQLTPETPSGVGKTILVSQTTLNDSLAGNGLSRESLDEKFKGEVRRGRKNPLNKVKNAQRKEEMYFSKEEEEVMAYVRANRMATSQGLAESVGISRQTAYRRLFALVQKGVLKTAGGLRNRTYHEKGGE